MISQMNFVNMWTATSSRKLTAVDYAQTTIGAGNEFESWEGALSGAKVRGGGTGNFFGRAPPLVWR